MGGYFLKNILFALLILLPAPLFAANDAPTKRLEVLANSDLIAGAPVAGTIIMRDIASGEVITLDDLKFNNKQRIHLWLVDPTFTDIQHVHPEATTTPYALNFTFTPKVSGSYMVWADITIFSGNKQELLGAWMGPKDMAFIERIGSYTKTMNGYNFSLSVDVAPKVGQTSFINLNVTDSQNKPVRWSVDSMLKPYSTSEYFNIIGFYDDNEHAIASVQEITPTSFGDPFEGPDVKFKITPTQAGFVKMFAHVTIAGKEMFVPFSIAIQK